MKKTNKKMRIKKGARVQLKSEQASDGLVVDVVGKAKWKVKWSDGSLKGQTTDQSSKSLRLWQVDLSAVEVESSCSSDSGDDAPAPDAPGADDEYKDRKRKFEAVAKSLEGKSVQVR